MTSFIARHIHSQSRASHGLLAPLTRRDLRFFLGRKLSVSVARRQLTVLSTLDPNRLQESDYIDLGADNELAFHDSSRESGISEAFRIAYTFHPARDTTIELDKVPKKKKPVVIQAQLWNLVANPFPAGTKGFLYYKKDREEIRFREAFSSNLYSFTRGRDLLTPTGLHWNIPLYKIVLTKLSMLNYQPLQKSLRKDGLVNDLHLDSFTKWASIGKLLDRATVVKSVGDTFAVDIGMKNYVYSRSSSGIRSMSLPVFYASHPTCQPVPHFIGTVLVKVDDIDKQESTNINKPYTKSLRGLRIVKCVSVSPTPAHDGTFKEPAEGDLLQTAVRLVHLPKKNGDWALRADDWTFDITLSKHAAAVAVRTLRRTVARELNTPEKKFDERRRV